MAEEQVDAILTSSQDQTGITTNCREIILNNQLTIAREKPYNHGQTEEPTSTHDW